MEKMGYALDFSQTTTHQLNHKLTDIWFPDLQNNAANTYLLNSERTLKMVQLCSQVTDYYYYYYYPFEYTNGGKGGNKFQPTAVLHAAPPNCLGLKFLVPLTTTHGIA